MGSEIHKSVYSDEDYALFRQKWLEELAFVQKLFKEGGKNFSDTLHIGYELEACILDNENRPAPCNEAILNDLNTPEYTSELANYDLEMNGGVFELNRNAPQALHEELSALWQKAQNSAQKFETKLGLFGVLPSLTPEHFDRKKYQSKMRRYSLASKRIHELRHESIKLLFSGEDVVSLERNDVMSEALSTSLQVHFQVPFERSVDYYHAALHASVIMVGIAANSPLILGKRAWQESRIPIFEQSVDARDRSRRAKGDEQRVHFSHGYIDSWMELFEQNKAFKILFPDVVDKSIEKLYHLNLHNGTIWRWIRPIISLEKNGKWSIRMELRVLPAGPTLADSEANIWCFVGLIEALVQSKADLTQIPFEVLKEDFYRVAKYGIESSFHNPLNGEKENLQAWMLHNGIALAQRGLENLGISAREQLEIIRERTQTGQTGAVWQLKHFKKQRSIETLVEAYMQHFEQNIPVHTWKLGESLLNITTEIPEAFLTIDYREVKQVFEKPSLVYLKGEKEPPLFISIMLHGNEFSGLQIMQEVLKKYFDGGAYKLPRSLWLFVGNVEAAALGLRRMDEELDFNRAWPGTLQPEAPNAQVISKVMEQITRMELFAALDLHNNTGKNPPYGCISVVNEKNKYLASYFNHIAMVFHTPKGVSTMAFDDICPAITLECSTPGNRPAIEKAVALIDDLMHMDHFPEKPLPEHDLQLVQNSAVLKVAEEVNFGFEHEDGTFDLTLVDNFDRHNFTTLKVGEVFAHTTVEKPLIATSENGVDVTDALIEVSAGAVSLKQPLMPAMITLDKHIIRQDCLCYLLEGYVPNN